MARVRIAAVVALLVVVAVACGGSGSSSGSGSGGGSGSSHSNGPAVYEQGDSISVKVGDEFVVALDANPTTGYAWTAAANPDVTYVSSKQVQPKSKALGTPGTQQLTFRATQAGSTTLVLNYAWSFEPGVPPAQTASFPVTVTG